ncbi:DUF1028 domain-containing protein [Pararoseomonas indoligenes]|uniref:DUF1028 domain-containing protein n=1 Tax=Roseomonas indoligenes TaxID=2820811 RepID=A0A940MUL7_9PROT|nr:DUF1028 domain-containing protein [Pararoseomonas indoligenes]MBP0493729.1 DUF1028 domain-containing protein [Pararoseomonas indoligenes]
MTFSLLGRCARTGQIGAAGATSDLAVGARIQHVAPGIGAVLTQHRTDPRLGPRGLALLRSGCGAAETVAALVASTPHADWRQLAALDATGRSAHHHGARVKPARAAAQGQDCVALGNILANEAVPAAMLRAFEADPAAPLGDRLLAGLAAGQAAGGEHGPVFSAVLEVWGDQDFALADLRVDRAAAPIAELAGLWKDWAPKIDEFVLRVLDPDRARGGAAGSVSPPGNTA